MTMPATYRAWYFGDTTDYTISDAGGSFDNLIIGGSSGSVPIPGLRRNSRTFTSGVNTIAGAPSYFNFISTDFAIRAVAAVDPGTNLILSRKLDAFLFRVTVLGDLEFSFTHRNTASSTTVTTTGIDFRDGALHDFVAVKQTGTLRLIVDGAQVATAPLIISDSTNDDGDFICNGAGILWGSFESLEVWRDYGTDTIPTITDFADDFYSTSTISLRNVYPVDGEADVDIGESIEFWLDDTTNNVVTATLDVTINGDSAIINGTAQSGYFVTLTNTPGLGLHVEIKLSLPLKAKNWWDSQLTVDVYAENDALDILSKSFIFYATADIEIPYLLNHNPVPSTRFIPLNSSIFFEVCDDKSGVDVSKLLIEIDEYGINNFITVFSGGSFFNGYNGTISLNIDERQYDCTIISPTNHPVAKPIYVRVSGEDLIGNAFIERYWIKTELLEESLIAVTPKDGEQLVNSETSIILNFKDNPTTVLVDNILAYDHNDSPAFKNGWSGVYLNDLNGKRLVLDSPTPFTKGIAVEIIASTIVTTNTYTFISTVSQITTDNESIQPRITKIGSEIWSARIKEIAGQLQLRKGDPPGIEQGVIFAKSVDVGYDATLGKFVLLYIADGKVYYSVADPIDPPETLPEPSTVNSDIMYALDSGYFTQQVTTFTPVKRAMMEESITRIDSGFIQPLSIYGAAPGATSIVSGPPEFATVTINMQTSTSLPSTFVGYDLMRYNPESGIAEHVAFIPGTNINATLVYEDNVYLQNSLYFVYPIFDVGFRNERGYTRSTPVMPPTGSTLILYRPTDSGYVSISWSSISPIKRAFEDIDVISNVIDSGHVTTIWVGFGVIGVG